MSDINEKYAKVEELLGTPWAEYLFENGNLREVPVASKVDWFEEFHKTNMLAIDLIHQRDRLTHTVLVQETTIALLRALIPAHAE